MMTNMMMNENMNPADMQDNAAKASTLLKSMANETRLLILCHLAVGEKSVGALLDNIPLSQSALSQHLAILRRERLVSTRRSAQSVFYTLASADVAAVMSTLHELYCQSEPARKKSPDLKIA